MKKFSLFTLFAFFACCLAAGLAQFPDYTPQSDQPQTSGSGVESLPGKMQTGANPPKGGSCARIGEDFGGENPFQGWPVKRFRGDWRTVSAWWCDPNYFRGYTHWGIDLTAKVTRDAWESIALAEVRATVREDTYGVVLGAADDGGEHYGMGNHVLSK